MEKEEIIKFVEWYRSFDTTIMKPLGVANMYLKSQYYNKGETEQKNECSHEETYILDGEGFEPQIKCKFCKERLG